MLHLYRWYRADGTYGLYTDHSDMPVAACIERPWKSNEKFVSCVPEGRYLVKRRQSPKHGLVWELQDVPGRTDIQIHVANWTHELLGCMAPGLYHGKLSGKPAVIDSATALKKLDAAIGNVESWELEIRGVRQRVSLAKTWLEGDIRDDEFDGRMIKRKPHPGQAKLAGGIPLYKRVWMFLDGRKTLIGLVMGRIGDAMGTPEGQIIRTVGDLIAAGGAAHKLEKSVRGNNEKKKRG